VFINESIDRVRHRYRGFLNTPVHAFLPHMCRSLREQQVESHGLNDADQCQTDSQGGAQALGIDEGECRPFLFCRGELRKSIQEHGAEQCERENARNHVPNPKSVCRKE
jgi:hypothetical protein